MKSSPHCTGLFLLLIVLTGCSAIKPREPSPEEIRILHQLQEAQGDWNKGDYEILATRENTVSCETSDPSCGTLHLMTGSACFRTSRYPCAVDHLEKGIAQALQKAFDDLGLDRTATALNLLESLRTLLLREKENVPLETARRLRNAADQFRSFAPEHPAGPFFWGSAELVLLRANIPEDPIRLCQELTALIETVQNAGPPSSSIRDTTYYRQLLSDISGAQQTVPHCSSEE